MFDFDQKFSTRRELNPISRFAGLSARLAFLGTCTKISRSRNFPCHSRFDLLESQLGVLHYKTVPRCPLQSRLEGRRVWSLPKSTSSRTRQSFCKQLKEQRQNLSDTRSCLVKRSVSKLKTALKTKERFRLCTSRCLNGFSACKTP